MGGFTCTICTLPKEVLTQIDNKLRKGVAQKRVAEEYGVSKDAIGRHYRAGHHIIVPTVAPSALPTEQKGKQPPVIYSGPDGLSKSIYQVMGAVEEIFQRCKETGADRQALEAAKVVKQFHELGAKIEGLIKEGQINILVNPQWLTIRAAIMRALERHPELKDDVLSELRGADSNYTIEGEADEVFN